MTTRITPGQAAREPFEAGVCAGSVLQALRGLTLDPDDEPRPTLALDADMVNARDWSHERMVEHVATFLRQEELL